jgi:hypothetical protein
LRAPRGSCATRLGGAVGTLEITHIVSNRPSNTVVESTGFLEHDPVPSKVDFDADAVVRCCFDEFTPWVPWAKRAGLTETKWNYAVATYPGVYLLARFDRTPPVGSADYLASGVVYVGEGRNLGRRWNQFEDSAFGGKSGHSGGWAYRRKYGSEANGIHVAALPIWFGNDLHASAEDWTQTYRLYVERRIVWEVTVARGGAHGLLNKK